MAWGKFQVRGRAAKITPPRPCAWVFRKDEQGMPTSVRIYPTKAQALKTMREEEGWGSDHKSAESNGNH